MEPTSPLWSEIAKALGVIAATIAVKLGWDRVRKVRHDDADGELSDMQSVVKRLKRQDVVLAGQDIALRDIGHSLDRVGDSLDKLNETLTDLRLEIRELRR